MTPSQLSKVYGFSRQAICRNINSGRVKAVKHEGRWMIREEDYKDYLSSRYVRKVPVIKEDLGNYSPKQCAEILNCSIQRIYHHIRAGYIKATRYGHAWVVNINDLMEYKKLLVPSTERTKGYERKYKCFPYRSLTSKS